MTDEEVLVLAAMPRELRPLARALRLTRGSVAGLPAWRGKGIAAVAVGVGPARAGRSAASALETTGARRVLVTGVAGGVGTGLQVGDVVRPATVVDVRSGAVFTPAGGPGRSGVLATVDRVLFSATEAGPAPGTDLPEGTVAVDMETAAIAAACEERGVPWDVVRAVSDVAGTLTPAIASLLRPDGGADVRAAASLVLREPRALGSLVRLGRDTARAVRRASAAVVAELGTPTSARRTDE